MRPFHDDYNEYYVNKHKDLLTSFIIPDGVTKILRLFFHDFVNLETVLIPESVSHLKTVINSKIFLFQRS